MRRHAWRICLALLPSLVAGGAVLGAMRVELAPKDDGKCPIELKGTTDLPTPPPPPPKAKEVTIEPWELVQV